MSTPYLRADAPLDFVEELQLRRWARQNYVAATDRRVDWHPVVREEMQLRDAEMIVKTRTREPASTYVPLAPTDIQRIHPGHEAVHSPSVAMEPGTESVVVS